MLKEMNDTELMNVNGGNGFTEFCGDCWDWCCDHKEEIGMAILIAGGAALTGGTILAAAAAGGIAVAGTAGLGTALCVGGMADICAGTAIYKSEPSGKGKK